MIDTGCSVTLISVSASMEMKREQANTKLVTIDGTILQSLGVVQVQSVRTADGKDLGQVLAHVLPSLPVKVDFVIGLDLILRHGLTVYRSGHSEFATMCGVIKNQSLSIYKSIDDPDFSAEFVGGHWNVKWKWKEGCVPKQQLAMWNHHIAQNDKSAFDSEISSWIEQGIPVEHDESIHGKVQRYLPMLGVRQEKGEHSKVRPVFDYRGINKTIESHPGGATPLCADRLRQWRQVGSKCAILDLKKAYLQIHMEKPFWVHQAVQWNKKVYLLTRLGFGLASAPKIMTKIVETVLEMDPVIKNGTSS